MAQTNFPLAEIERNFKAAIQRAPLLLGNHALNFFLDRFKEQAWLGSTKEPWAPRKKNSWSKKSRAGRSILIDKGRLRRATRIVNANMNTVAIGNDAPYARAHNEGYRGTITQNVGAFSRKSKVGGKVAVKAHSRRIDQNIPKRQFMGYSPILDKQLTALLQAELMKGLTSLNFKTSK
jgi:phage gpG-like protein